LFLLPIIKLCVGFALLTFSADRFVCGISLLGRFLGCSSMFVGIVLVGFATALPEMLVSFLAAWHGHNQLAIGNAFGSFITNIGLVFGVITCIKTIKLNHRLVRYEWPIMGGCLLIALGLLHDGLLSRHDAWILLIGLVGYMIYLYWMSRREPVAVVHDVMASQRRLYRQGQSQNTLRIIGAPILFFALMLGAVDWVTQAAVALAHSLGLSELVIGLTVVAIGTSLPELAASVAAVYRNEFEIAVGNVIGSNIIGMLGVLPMASLFSDTVCSRWALLRDGGVMVLGVLLLFLLLRPWGQGRYCFRYGAGIVFLSYFIIYLVSLFLFPL
jgi:cation:H+ antiporter